jgi:hypothetical protein
MRNPLLLLALCALPHWRAWQKKIAVAAAVLPACCDAKRMGRHGNGTALAKGRVMHRPPDKAGNHQPAQGETTDECPASIAFFG